MKKQLLITLVLLIAIAGSSWAGEITLKHSLFWGWKYSADSNDFHRVGFTGNSLRERMEGNEEAVDKMYAYRERKIEAAVFGWPGGFMVGWACSAAIWGDWKDSDGVLLGVGLGLMLVAEIIEMSATRCLKEAVAIYSGEEQAPVFDLNLTKPPLASGSELTLALKYTF